MTLKFINCTEAYRLSVENAIKIIARNIGSAAKKGLTFTEEIVSSGIAEQINDYLRMEGYDTEQVLLTDDFINIKIKW